MAKYRGVARSRHPIEEAETGLRVSRKPDLDDKVGIHDLDHHGAPGDLIIPDRASVERYLNSILGVIGAGGLSLALWLEVRTATIAKRRKVLVRTKVGTRNAVQVGRIASERRSTDPWAAAPICVLWRSSSAFS